MAILKHLFEMLKVMLSAHFNSDADGGSTKTNEIAIVKTKREVSKIDGCITNDDIINASNSKPLKPRFCFPVNNYITSQFGYRVLEEAYKDTKPRFHAAHDYSAYQEWGTPVKCPEDGVVIDNKIGNAGITYVTVKGDYSGCYLYLMHCGSKQNGISPLVKEGQAVRAGDTVGYINASGRTTGPHLHFSVWTSNWQCIDPMCYWQRFAPEIASAINRYVDNRVLHSSNKTGIKCAGI